VTTVNVHQAKTQLSKLLQQVEAGETIVIARAGKPSAQLVPINAHPKGINPPGAMRDQISIGDDFDLPLDGLFDGRLEPSRARYQSTTSNESFLREIDNVMLHGGLPGSEQSIQPSEVFIATQRTTPIPLLVPISLGELIDKVTILQIKTLYLHGSALENVKKELDTLENIVNNLQPNIDPALIQRLKEVNQDLWHIEDDIRDHERQQNFGESFVRLARSVYQQNDLRSIIKKEINTTYGSVFVEEKSYQKY